MSLLESIVIKRVANAVAQPPHSASAYPAGHSGYPQQPYSGYYDHAGPSQPPAYEAAQRFPPAPYPPPPAPRPLTRPLVLPQTTHSPQAPFVRGYSSDLAALGVPLEAFVAFVDELNCTIVPSAELFAVQKAARIGGLFVPGVGHLAGRAVGAAAQIGSSVSVQNSTSALLEAANARLFNPAGVHAAILTTAQLQAHVGAGGRNSIGYGLGYGLDRLAGYAGAVAPVDSVLPELGGGATASRGWQASNNDRRTAKAERKAQRGLDRGKMRKADRLESAALWLVVSRL
ncbi:hypothetical protein Q8F55_004464 [Vanrija albida]|uniref:Uncharacterized protein n=1 Tax=Vanrija albida TaxID=181172 RepID=A0ABR3Q6S8_9TREE